MLRLARANSAFQAGRTGLDRVPKSPSRRRHFGARILAQPQPNFRDLDDDRTVANSGLTQPLTLAEHLAVHTLRMVSCWESGRQRVVRHHHLGKLAATVAQGLESFPGWRW